VGLADNENYEKVVPKEFRDKVDEIRKKIIDGKSKSEQHLENNFIAIIKGKVFDKTSPAYKEGSNGKVFFR